MKKTFLILSIIAIYGCFMTSCKNKKQDAIAPIVNNPSSTMNQFFANNGAKKQLFTVNVDNAMAVITGKKGTTVRFPKGAFSSKDGQPVTGDVKIQLIEIYDQIDMLLSDRPTTSNGELLVSGGEIFISATADGQELELNDTTSILVSLPTDYVDKDMTLFTGSVDSNQFNWTVIPNVVATQNQVNPNDTSWASNTEPYFYYDPSKYIFTVRNLGWINCDRFYDAPIKTDVKVACGNQFDVKNTRAYMVFKSINSVSELYYYSGNGLFNITNTPVGENVTIVMISLTDGKEYIGIKDVTITSGINVSMDLVEASENEITELLKQKLN